MKRKLGLIAIIFTLVLAGFQIYFPSPAQAAAYSLTSNYSASPSGTLDLNKVMNAAQGGHSYLYNTHMMPDMYGKFTEMGMRTIRVSHLLNDMIYDPVTRVNGVLQFDFAKLDTAFVPLVNAGMKPLMNISFTPDELGGTTGQGFDVPNNWTEWEQCVTALVTHYYNKGAAYRGLDWMIWNEPDYGFWLGTQAQLNELYERTVRIVKQIDPTAKVGGYGDAQHTSAYLSSLINFVQARNNDGSLNNDVPLDFVAFHQYNYENDPFNDRVDYVKGLLNNAGLTNTKIYMTEWARNAGAANETNVDAPWYARQLYQAALKTDLAKLFIFEAIGGLNTTADTENWNGAISSRGHRKAIFHTYKMFSQMQPTILSTSYGGSPPADKSRYGFVTKDAGSSKVAALLWNYSSSSTTMDLTINNLPYLADGKNIKVTKYQIDQDKANWVADPLYLKMWGYKTSPMETLDPQESSIVASSSTFSRTSVTLPPYSVVQFLLEPTTSAPTPGPVIADTVIPFPNYAARATVTSSSSIENWGWTRANLVDEIPYTLNKVDQGPVTNGFSSTNWSKESNTEWVQVDLDAPRSINQVKLYPRNDYGFDGKAFPKDFTIQGLNGTSWVTLSTQTNYNSGNPVSGPQTFNFTAGNYSKVRLTATKLGLESPGVYRLMLSELEVYSTTTAPGPVHNFVYKILNNANKHVLHMSADAYITDAYKAPMVGASYNSNNQKWTLIDAGSGYWKIQSVSSPSHVLQATTDVYNGAAGVYHVAVSPSSWNSLYQQWELVPVAGTIYYKIRNRGNPLVVLQSTADIYNGLENVFSTVASPEAWDLREHRWILAKQ